MQKAKTAKEIIGNYSLEELETKKQENERLQNQVEEKPLKPPKMAYYIPNGRYYKIIDDGRKWTKQEKSVDIDNDGQKITLHQPFILGDNKPSIQLTISYLLSTMLKDYMDLLRDYNELKADKALDEQP